MRPVKRPSPRAGYAQRVLSASIQVGVELGTDTPMQQEELTTSRLLRSGAAGPCHRYGSPTAGTASGAKPDPLKPLIVVSPELVPQAVRRRGIGDDSGQVNLARLGEVG